MVDCVNVRNTLIRSTWYDNTHMTYRVSRMTYDVSRMTYRVYRAALINLLWTKEDMVRRIGKTSALVESGILAAVAVLFTLIGNYVPVLDMIVNVLWPLPIILCGRRNGLKWSVLCLIVTGCVVAVLLSPLQALTQCLILGLIGLMMGYGMRRQLSPVKTLLLGSLGALISVILSGIAAYVFMNINVIETFYSSLDESLDISSGIFQTLGLGNAAEAQLAQMKKMFELILPAGVLLSAPITAFANYWAARKVLARMGDYYPWFPPMSLWTLPKWLLLPYGIGMVMMVYFGKDDASIMYRLAFTVYTMVSMMLLLQGLCVVRWYVEYRGGPKFLLPLALMLTFTMPIASQALVVTGAYEMVVDFRKIRHKKPGEE